MGAPAAVTGDQITATCAVHQVPGPTGTPIPSPAPLPFAAPLTTGLAATVLVGGRPVAVAGSAGLNTPPHVGLHVSDPFMVPAAQQGQVVAGSATVLAEGRGVAYSGCQVTGCAQLPGLLTGSAATVLVGP
ncbi:PAAR domain-containing protein [Frankia sp. QA3]|uniref:PAAR domain-containing protein n=1 Tax=Frankia sp. QA3 TaxID=710111 RepID=UPI000269BFFF|nr:PAAR domain-containing protein [Frankia sp. QA3]EIV92961.1 hypothetical protein FraQA3DRAFT_2634 [Frankia sp. QA3]